MGQADIAVYNPAGERQLVVEIKNKSGASTDWAIRMRRNLSVHGFIPPAPYFLLVLSDALYLWTNASTTDELAPPDYQINAIDILGPYLQESPPSLNELTEYSLELLVTLWLEDILNTQCQQDLVDHHQQWLVDSGLYAAISHGSITIKATT